MTVPSETSSTAYTGNAVTTAFPTVFRFIRNVDIVVKLTPSGGAEVIQTEGAHYTLTGATLDGGGTVTFLTAPPLDAAVVIERDVPFTQTTSYRTQGSFAPAVHEESFDYSVFRDQELARRVTALEAQGAPGSVEAGNGLSFSSTTLHVGAGAGITTSADAVAVDFGATGSLVNVAKSAAAAGSIDQAARIDHKHNISTAAPGNQLLANGSSLEGVATTLARSDHTHDVGAEAPLTVSVNIQDIVPRAASNTGAQDTLARTDHQHAAPWGTPVNVTKAAAADGTASAWSRSDHKHDISTAAALAITDATNSEGTATTLARSDHRHAHGNMTTPTLHAEATTSAAGFESVNDKKKTEKFFIGRLQTTNATPANIQFTDESMGVFMLSGDLIMDGAGDLELADTFLVMVTAKKVGGVGAASFGYAVSVHKAAGAAPVVLNQTTLWAHNSGGGAATWGVAFACNWLPAAFSTLAIGIGGEAATTIDWRVKVSRISSLSLYT